MKNSIETLWLLGLTTNYELKMGYLLALYPETNELKLSQELDSTLHTNSNVKI